MSIHQRAAGSVYSEIFSSSATKKNCVVIFPHFIRRGLWQAALIMVRLTQEALLPASHQTHTKHLSPTLPTFPKKFQKSSKKVPKRLTQEALLPGSQQTHTKHLSPTFPLSSNSDMKSSKSSISTFQHYAASLFCTFCIIAIMHSCKEEGKGGILLE